MNLILLKLYDADCLVYKSSRQNTRVYYHIVLLSFYNDGAQSENDFDLAGFDNEDFIT